MCDGLVLRIQEVSYIRIMNMLMPTEIPPTKHIMKLEHMAMLYKDRQNETKWYISMLLAHISEQILERQYK